MVKFRINRTLRTGSVRKPNLRGMKSVSLLLGFAIVFGSDFDFNSYMLMFFLQYREHSSLLQGNCIHIGKVNF